MIRKNKNRLNWLSKDEIDHKTIEDFEWSMGNGQCELCHGHKPNMDWWTDTIGHHKKCPLAALMKKAGMEPIYEIPNPNRSVGIYIPNADKNGNGVIVQIRYNDPNKKEKMAIGKKQFYIVGTKKK